MEKQAAIVGGGVIGGGWAARIMLNGWDVRVFDPDPEAERKITAVISNARAALPGLTDVALPDEGSLTLCGSIAEATKGADFIVEAVPERLDIKHSVYAEIEVVNADGLIASSTSGIMPTDLQAKMAHPERLIVGHPFNPVYLLPLVEVVPHPLCSEATRALCFCLKKRLRATARQTAMSSRLSIGAAPVALESLARTV